VKRGIFERFEVLTTLNIKIMVFWGLTLCSVVVTNILEELAVSIFYPIGGTYLQDNTGVTSYETVISSVLLTGKSCLL
jgi:hypothetical protein